MTTIKVTDQKGAELHDIELNEAVFGVTPNQQAMFDAVVMQRASLRQGTADTKGRSEVHGTGKFVKRELAELDMLKKLLHNLEVAELYLGLLQEVMHTE